MMSATSVLSTHDTRSVIIGVYLLGLRHPMLAARQVATLSQIAPGRLILGALELLRALLTDEEVTHVGEYLHLDRA